MGSRNARVSRGYDRHLTTRTPSLTSRRPTNSEAGVCVLAKCMLDTQRIAHRTRARWQGIHAGAGCLLRESGIPDRTFVAPRGPADQGSPIDPGRRKDPQSPPRSDPPSPLIRNPRSALLRDLQSPTGASGSGSLAPTVYRSAAQQTPTNREAAAAQHAIRQTARSQPAAAVPTADGSVVSRPLPPALHSSRAVPDRGHRAAVPSRSFPSDHITRGLSPLSPTHPTSCPATRRAGLGGNGGVEGGRRVGRIRVSTLGLPRAAGPAVAAFPGPTAAAAVGQGGERGVGVGPRPTPCRRGFRHAAADLGLLPDRAGLG